MGETACIYRPHHWLSSSGRAHTRATVVLSQGATAAFHISLLHPHERGSEGASELAAVLVRAATSEAQQQVLYEALCDAAQETHEWQAALLVFKKCITAAALS